MKTIASEVVDKTWQRVAGLSNQQGAKLAERMSQEQPFVMAYLMAVDHELLDQDERELLFYVGTVIWQIMSEGAKPLPQVTEKRLDEAEAANVGMLESLVGAPDADLTQAAEKLLVDYNQPAVLEYAMEALMEAAEDQEVRQDNLGIMLIDCKTVIDAFDR